MKRFIGLSMVLCLLMAAAATLAAQAAPAPPKVLVIAREFIKPGKAGGPHMKTESAFVQAMTAAKWPTHYLGADALTGPSRAVFFTGYDSLDAWGKDLAAEYANPKLGPALDRAFIADGELLTSIDTNVFGYRPDLSLNPSVDLPHMRYFEVTVFRTKPGHEPEWEDIAKMYVKDFGKEMPSAHFVTYMAMYGHDSGSVYVVIFPMKSLAEADQEWAASNKFMEQMGESGMKKMLELTAASTASTESNILAFNPVLSYVEESWIKADPKFWKPGAAAPATPKPAPKPAQ